MASGIKPLLQFTRKLMRHERSILAYCDYPIHTSVIEGINNRIKVIKWIAFGFTNISLKIRAAFQPIHTRT